jgi:hypothetical protein
MSSHTMSQQQVLTEIPASSSTIRVPASQTQCWPDGQVQPIVKAVRRPTLQQPLHEDLGTVRAVARVSHNVTPLDTVLC